MSHGSWGKSLVGIFALAVAGSALLGTGCSKERVEGPQQCTTSNDCAAGERCDAITKGCTSRCSADNHCPRNSGTRCEEETGACVPAELCQKSYNCGSSDQHTYCGGDASCVCVADASVAASGDGMSGVCWRPSRLCEPCEESLECGAGLAWLRETSCKPFKVGSQETSVCLPQHERRCPPGMVAANPQERPDLEGLCLPQGGDCGALRPCRSDDDCPSSDLPTCDLVRQVCTPGCSYDLVARETMGCNQRQVCNANPHWIDASLLASCESYPLYALGSCAAACESDVECRAIDPSFICKDDGAGPRCRPPGCMDDVECQSGNPGYNGFCDLASGQCTYDACRQGIDLSAGCGIEVPFVDCKGGFKCVGPAGQAFGGCVKLDCIESGGTQIACSLGNFCAGAPYHDPLTSVAIEQTVPVPVGVEEGSCYGMDIGPWCQVECKDSTECEGGPLDYPSSPPDCATHGLTNPICFWGCEFMEDCPAAWACSSRSLRTECGSPDIGPGMQWCQSDDDCATGSSCVTPIVGGEPLDREFKVCECTNSGACGAGYQCNQGIASATLDRNKPDYLQVQARYCADSAPCGAGGSCEWFGDMNDTAVASGTYPISVCANAPAVMQEAGVRSTCPATDTEGRSSRPGKLMSDQVMCVHTSVCQPGFVASDSTNPNSPRVCKVL